MRVRSVKLRAAKRVSGTVVVEPPLARLEARDYRVTRSGVMFRCMLIGRIITAADVATLGASAPMKPPLASSPAFEAACPAWRGGQVDTFPFSLHRFLFQKRLCPEL